MSLPFDVGTTCFPFLVSAGASPVIVANSIGRPDKVGESQFFGIPAEDPDPATTTLFLPSLPQGTELTFQALIVDPGAVSSRGVSTTNAVVLEVVP